MKKIFLFGTFILLIFINFIFPNKVNSSKQQNLLPAITVINLIRGNELGHEKDDLYSSLKVQFKITKDAKVNATWLFQYSILENENVVDFAKSEMKNQEFGLLFEIDRNTAKKAGVQYRGQGPWYFSDGLFLFSYDISERKKIIDASFSKFKEKFGYYPKTVGAWWIGADSLSYMQEKYGIVAALRAADQFNLDFYSIWGTPWSIPYLSSKQNQAIPASSWKDSSKVVILQWAARDPLKGYKDPLYSIQDYPIKQYDTSYVDYLSSIFLRKPFDNLVFGLENGGTLETFSAYYKTMLVEAKKLQEEKKASVSLAKDYSQAFLNNHKVFSDNNYYLSNDYNSDDQSFWFNSENFRVGIQKNGENIYLVDLRDYTRKVKEDFVLLPNSQAHLYVQTPAIIDSMRFSDQKILIAKNGDSMKIKEQNGAITLYSGDKKIAFLNSTTLELFSDNSKEQIYNFNIKKENIFPLYILISIYLFYFLIIYIHKRNFKKSFIQICILAIPLIMALLLLGKDPTFLFDRKELLLFNFSAVFYFPSIVNGIIFIKFVPFFILIALHYIFIIKNSQKFYKTIYFIFLSLITLLYVNIPYFPLDKSTYLSVFIVFMIFAFVLLILSVSNFLKTKSKKHLAVSLIFIPFVLIILALLMFISRTKYALTPFEIDALNAIKNQSKDVLYVSQIDYSIKPIYKEIRPLLYYDYKFGEKLTAKRWQMIVRPQNHILKISNYENKLIVIPRYLGADLSDYEIEQLKLKKIFDNAQIAIFEKK